MPVVKPTLAYSYTLYTNGATLYKSSTQRSETSVTVSTSSNNGSTDIYGDKFCDPTDYPVSDYNSSNGWMAYGYHFVYEGYTFSHWNTAADGSSTSYFVGDNLPSSPSVDNNYYAIWEEIQYGYQDEICNIMGCLPMGASLEPSETSNSPTLIEFTIYTDSNLLSGTTYQAEEGMTWTEWVESEYNTDGYFINVYDHIVTVAGTSFIYKGDDAAGPSQIITTSDIYSLHSGMGGGAN